MHLAALRDSGMMLLTGAIAYSFQTVSEPPEPPYLIDQLPIRRNIQNGQAGWPWLSAGHP
jgi:hypothetical protein